MATDGRFIDAVASITSRLRGIPKDDLFGEDLRRHRQTITAISILLAIAVAAAALAEWQRRVAVWRADETAAAFIWSRLDFDRRDDPRSEATVQALWDLSLSSTGVRDAFVRQLASDRYQVDTLVSSPTSIVRAFGLRPSNEIVQRFLGPVLEAMLRTTNPSQLEASARAVQALGRTPEQTQAALGAVFSAIRRTTDAEELLVLARASHVLGTTFPAELAEMAIWPVVNAIVQADRGTWELSTLGAASRAIGAMLTPEQAQAALRPVLATIRQTDDPRKVSALANAIQSLRPSPQQAEAALGPVLDAMAKSMDDFSQRTLMELNEAAKGFGTNPAPDKADVAFGLALNAIVTRKYNPVLHGSLAETLRILGPALSPVQAHAMLKQVLDALRRTTYPYKIAALAEAVHILRPTPEQAQLALASVIDDIHSYTEPMYLEALAPAVQFLVPTQAQVQAVLNSILNAVPLIIEPYDISSLASAIWSLQATPEQVQVILKPLLASINHTTDIGRLRALAGVAGVLGLKLGPEQSQLALNPVLDAIHQSSNPTELQYLGEALQGLGPTLTPEQAERAIEVLRSALLAVADPTMAETLAQAIALTLPAESPNSYVSAIVELLKWPTTAGPATDALLEVLHERVPRAPGKESGLDATIAWVAKTYPEIDLDSPPVFPSSGSTGGVW